MTALVRGDPSAHELPLHPLVTTGGRSLAGLRLQYRVLGNTRAARDNGWILVFHALTGSADAEQWWGPLVGPGKALDTSRHAVVAGNLLGSCYGSTGPQDWATEHDDPWPELTPADLAASHLPLLEHLGVERLALVTGGSLGGMVTLEWGRRSNVPVDRLVVFAAPAATSAQAIGWNTVQRMAIEADPAWQDGRYPPGQGPLAGLAAARALAMITYRSGIEFDARFGRASFRPARAGPAGSSGPARRVAGSSEPAACLHRGAYLGQPQRCGPEGFLPVNPRNQRVEHRSRSHCQRERHYRSR